MLVLALLTGVLCGCRRQEPAFQPGVVAEIGGVPVTQAQLQSAWERRQRGSTTNLPSVSVLSDLVDEAAAYAQAQRSGFMERPEIQNAIRQLIVAKYREAQQATNQASLEPVDRELRAAYVERTNLFVRPASLNVGVIVHEVPRTATPEKREEARQQVARWRQEILASTNVNRAFGQAAGSYSADSTTRYRRGEVGWLSHAELSVRLAPEVVTAASEMKEGSISEPIATPRGFYLIQLLGKRAAEVRPYAEMESTIRYQMREARRLAAETQFRTAIRSGLEIRTNMTLLNSLSLTNRPPSPPPVMPKG